MDIRAIGMGLAFAFMWSSAFTSARMIVMDAPPLTALAIRFLVSGGLAIALARLAGQTWHLTRPQMQSVIVFGLCQNALYLGLNFVGMQWIEASLASIIASTMPLLVALIGWLAFRERLPPVAVVGLVAGMGGVALIMGARIEGGVNLTGAALCGIGALALALATLAVRGATSGGNLLMIVGLQMLVGAVTLGLVALLAEEWEVDWTARLGLAFIYTTLVPGLIATWVWFRLVDRIGAVRAAAFHFLNPFFGVTVAWALLGEPLRWADAAGVAIIMAGILAVQLSKAPAVAPEKTAG